jgi:TonB-dependent receptor
VLAAGLSHAAGDVPPSPDGVATLSPVVIRGDAGLPTSGSEIKRRSLNVSDAVTSDEFKTLHTPSVADALQRLPGIQLSRDRGEAGPVTLRGLPQVETTLNGREVFTAGGGRTLDLSDIPADLVRSITVHKSAAADQLGGGLAGVVDLQTWRPFDFAQPQAQVSAHAVHSNASGHGSAQGAVLWSNRWRTGGDSEWGALLNLSVQDKPWRENQVSVAPPSGLRTDLVPGQAVYAPAGMTLSRSEGTRQRVGAQAMLQWRPAAPWELYAEASSSRFSTRQDTHQITTSPGASAGVVPGSVALFPGTTDVRTLTWARAPYSTLGFARDTVDRTSQQAVGGRWTGDDVAWSADLSRTRSHNALDFTSLTLNGVAPGLTAALGDATPSLTMTGADPGQLARDATAGLVRAVRPFDGTLSAAQVDGDVLLHHEWVESLRLGMRWSHRWASNMPGQVVYASPLVPASGAGFAVHPAPDSGWLTGDPDATRDPDRLRQGLGLTGTLPAANWLGAWTMDEQTHSAHAMAILHNTSSRIDGHVGVRLLHHRDGVQGYMSTPTSNGVQPVSMQSSSLDVLPSLLLRHEWQPDLFVRVAASKTIARPDFTQLAPSLTLNPVLLTGTAGNPALKPIRSRNLDLTVERYWHRSAHAHATLFHKQVQGFVASVTGPETHDGKVYQVSRFQNVQSATLSGLELGVKAPVPWIPGLVLEANHTWVNTALQNVSRHSANLAGTYTAGPWTLRLAYNWRGRYVSSVVNVKGLGALPVYVAPQGWLDAALAYRYNKAMSFQVSGANLLNTRRSAYLGVPTRPYSVWTNDVQIMATAQIQF